MPGAVSIAGNQKPGVAAVSSRSISTDFLQAHTRSYLLRLDACCDLRLLFLSIGVQSPLVCREQGFLLEHFSILSPRRQANLSLTDSKWLVNLSRTTRYVGSDLLHMSNTKKIQLREGRNSNRPTNSLRNTVAPLPLKICKGLVPDYLILSLPRPRHSGNTRCTVSHPIYQTVLPAEADGLITDASGSQPQIR